MKSLIGLKEIKVVVVGGVYHEEGGISEVVEGRLKYPSVF